MGLENLQKNVLARHSIPVMTQTRCSGVLETPHYRNSQRVSVTIFSSKGCFALKGKNDKATRRQGVFTSHIAM